MAPLEVMTHRDQRTADESQFSPFKTWIPGMGLGSSDFGASAFIHRAMQSALGFHS